MTERFSTDIEIRFTDIDAYGHVNNAMYFTYLEAARLKLFKERFRELSSMGILFIVAKAECEYKKPITLYDRVVITMWSARAGRSSCDIEYELHNGDGKLYAKAKTTFVCLDASTQSIVPLPQFFRSLVT